MANAESTIIDYQMDRIRINIAKRMVDWTQKNNVAIPRWTDKNKEMAQLAYQMYYLVENRIGLVIDHDWMQKDSKLALIGGIIINCDIDGTDMFMPMRFEIHDKDYHKIDLLETFTDLTSKTD